MKKLFFLCFVLPITIFKTNNSSYFHHRNSGLQAYISSINDQTQYLKVERLRSLLYENSSIKYKNILSVLIFEQTLDAFSLEKLDNFKKLLEKKFLKEKTLNHKIDLLIAESLYEEKLKTKHDKNYREEKLSSFSHDILELLTNLNSLKKHDPLSYISFELKLMKAVEEKNVPANIKCFSALTNLFSPVTIKIV